MNQYDIYPKRNEFEIMCFALEQKVSTQPIGVWTLVEWNVDGGETFLQLYKHFKRSVKCNCCLRTNFRLRSPAIPLKGIITYNCSQFFSWKWRWFWSLNSSMGKIEVTSFILSFYLLYMYMVIYLIDQTNRWNGWIGKLESILFPNSWNFW